MGKGDTRRPSRVSKEDYDESFQRIFGRPGVTGDSVSHGRHDSRDIPTEEEGDGSRLQSKEQGQ